MVDSSWLMVDKVKGKMWEVKGLIFFTFHVFYFAKSYQLSAMSYELVLT